MASKQRLLSKGAFLFTRAQGCDSTEFTGENPAPIEDYNDHSSPSTLGRDIADKGDSSHIAAGERSTEESKALQQKIEREAAEQKRRIAEYKSPYPILPAMSMNPMAMGSHGTDPSANIAPELLRHVHLVSTYRFPQYPHLPVDKAAEWLISAPAVSRDKAPFYWTYLDRPQPGMTLLLWQTPQLGQEFPSDGYVWAPPEQAFQMEINGRYTLEGYHHKAGYVLGDQYTGYSRRRFRLLPKFSQPGMPQPDPSLWIVHYAQGEPQDSIPSSMIPISAQVQNSIQTRQYLQSQGQIMQKDFMLHDRPNWPSIAFPRDQGPQRAAPNFGGMPARVPQAMAYPPQGMTGPGPQPKRARPQASTGQAVAPGTLPLIDADDEEDTSRGDLFDHVTPREIAVSRYRQNHEFMEEVLSSPYPMKAILATDLGIAAIGDMKHMFEGVYDISVDPETSEIKTKYIGNLDKEQAAAFTKKVEDYNKKVSDDVEQMTLKHNAEMAKHKAKMAFWRDAELELRTAVTDPDDAGSEWWRLENKIEENESGEGKTPAPKPAKVSDIAERVQRLSGRRAGAIKELARIRAGGYQEAPNRPSPPAATQQRVSPPISHNGSHHSGGMIGDLDMDNSAAGLLDQYRSDRSSNATPGRLQPFSGVPTPQAQHSAAGTPNIMHVPSPQPQVSQTQAGHVASDPQGLGGDYVVVLPGDISPSGQAPGQPTSAPQHQTSTPAANTPAQAVHTNPNTNPSSAVNTPDLPDFHTSPNDFADLGDLDSAGDALASYGGEGEGLGELSMDLDMDMDVGGAFDAAAPGGEESAFEGAFDHHSHGGGGGVADM